jgi:DNA-binding CsgD family transcriptional regulator
MALFERVHMPSFAGATEWLNSEPLGPAELRGRVVLVNFWTWTCINWLRQEPYVRAWSQAYRDDGLIVIGVHTPEFSFEHEIDGVRRASRERAIDYPVAADNDYAIWSAFANQLAARTADAARARDHHALALGATSREIAHDLFVTTETVRTHIRNAMAKTGTRTRAHLVAAAICRGLLPAISSG